MHDGDGETHEDGAGGFAQTPGGDLTAEAEGKPHGDEGDDDGQRERECQQPRVEAAHCGEAHGVHADIVHGGDPAAHKQTAGDGCG